MVMDGFLFGVCNDTSKNTDQNIVFIIQLGCILVSFM